MSYEAWRISFQSSEQAARSAYNDFVKLNSRIAELEKDAARYQWLRTYAEVEIPQPWLAHNSLYRDDTDDTWDLVIDTAMQGREA